MAVEFEVKFQADLKTLAAIREAVPGQEQLYHMQTTYYDTPTGALSAKRWTLRRRMENQRSVCTLKTPAQGLGRREWETECESIEEALEKLCKLGGPEELLSLAKEGLVPVCGARFTRIAKTVQLSDGEAELALDQGVLMGGNKQLPLCEVELEQKSCTQRSCLDYARELADRFRLQQEKRSKFNRAFALYKGE